MLDRKSIKISHCFNRRSESRWFKINLRHAWYHIGLYYPTCSLESNVTLYPALCQSMPKVLWSYLRHDDDKSIFPIALRKKKWPIQYKHTLVHSSSINTVMQCSYFSTCFSSAPLQAIKAASSDVVAHSEHVIRLIHYNQWWIFDTETVYLWRHLYKHFMKIFGLYKASGLADFCESFWVEIL